MKKPRIHTIADWVFVFVIFLTIGFYAGNNYFMCQKLNKDVKLLKNQIQTIINKNVKHSIGQVPFGNSPIQKETNEQ